VWRLTSDRASLILKVVGPAPERGDATVVTDRSAI